MPSLDLRNKPTHRSTRSDGNINNYKNNNNINKNNHLAIVNKKHHHRRKSAQPGSPRKLSPIKSGMYAYIMFLFLLTVVKSVLFGSYYSNSLEVIYFCDSVNTVGSWLLVGGTDFRSTHSFPPLLIFPITFHQLFSLNLYPILEKIRPHGNFFTR